MLHCKYAGTIVVIDGDMAYAIRQINKYLIIFVDLQLFGWM